VRSGWVLIVVALGVGCVDLTRPKISVGALDTAPDIHGGDRPPPEVDRPDAEPDLPVSPIDGDDPAEAGEVDLAPDLPIEALPLDDGRPCSNANACRSGFCSQGVCCESDCNQICRACNLPGSEGMCKMVPAGEDARDNCAREAPSLCGQDGTLEVSGACRRYPVNSECEAGRCTSGVEYAARTCDGAGTCRGVTSKACPSGTCSGDTCGAPCSGTNPCQAGFYCLAGKCALTKPIGTTCTAASQCASNFCVDGYCCTSMCAETCFACNVASKLGTCTAVPAGQDPRAQCPAQAATTCGRAGGCNGQGSCRLHPVGTTCGATSCTASVETFAPTCDGVGVCRPPGGSRGCSPYVCGDSACATSCTDPDSCIPAYSCQGITCAPAPGLVLFWRFEDTGNTVVDSSPSGFAGTLDGDLGTPTSDVKVPPKVMYPNTHSRAFSLVSRHHIKIASLPAALRFSNNFTLALWYRSQQVDKNGGNDVGSELISGANAYLIRLRPLSSPSTQLEFAKSQASGIASLCRGAAATFLDGQWHHVAAVASSSFGVKIYYDGVEVCSNPTVNDVDYSNAGTGFFVGRHGSGETQWDFSGNMDEVRVYNRPLSALEISALAQGRNN
jgi:hypothetical protein